VSSTTLADVYKYIYFPSVNDARILADRSGTNFSSAQVVFIIILGRLFAPVVVRKRPLGRTRARPPRPGPACITGGQLTREPLTGGDYFERVAYAPGALAR